MKTTHNVPLKALCLTLGVHFKLRLHSKLLSNFLYNFMTNFSFEASFRRWNTCLLSKRLFNTSYSYCSL